MSPAGHATAGDCVLCVARNEAVVWRNDRLRVISAGDGDYPGYLRVVWQQHVREMTDLPPADRDACMHVVFAVERALRDTLDPLKINLATLGNQVAHLHWHVIPRHANDAHFPDAIWAPRRREGVPGPIDRQAFAARLATLLQA